MTCIAYATSLTTCKSTFIVIVHIGHFAVIWQTRVMCYNAKKTFFIAVSGEYSKEHVSKCHLMRLQIFNVSFPFMPLHIIRLHTQAWCMSKQYHDFQKNVACFLLFLPSVLNSFQLQLCSNPLLAPLPQHQNLHVEMGGSTEHNINIWLIDIFQSGKRTGNMRLLAEEGTGVLGFETTHHIPYRAINLASTPDASRTNIGKVGFAFFNSW